MSSVVIRGSCRFWRIILVYSSSIFCAGACVPLFDCATVRMLAGPETTTATATNAVHVDAKRYFIGVPREKKAAASFVSSARRSTDRFVGGVQARRNEHLRCDRQVDGRLRDEDPRGGPRREDPGGRRGNENALRGRRL